VKRKSGIVYICFLIFIYLFFHLAILSVLKAASEGEMRDWVHVIEDTVRLVRALKNAKISQLQVSLSLSLSLSLTHTLSLSFSCSLALLLSLSLALSLSCSLSLALSCYLSLLLSLSLSLALSFYIYIYVRMRTQLKYELWGPEGVGKSTLALKYAEGQLRAR
jgi:hypothetical protein